MTISVYFTNAQQLKPHNLNYSRPAHWIPVRHPQGPPSLTSVTHNSNDIIVNPVWLMSDSHSYTSSSWVIWVLMTLSAYVIAICRLFLSYYVIMSRVVRLAWTINNQALNTECQVYLRKFTIEPPCAH